MNSPVKGFQSLSPHRDNVTGENTLVNSALLDIATGYFDEIITTFIRLVQCHVCWLEPL